MSLPAYVLKGSIKRAIGLFGAITTTGINARSVVAGIIASTTHTLVGATDLTAEVNVIATCANAGDAVSLPALTVGQSCEVYNAGAAAAAVFPSTASYTIDGGSAGASVTLTNAKRARFTCTALNTIISAQLGVPSA